MMALILSGGFGTRLRPLTFHTPKPLLHVANVPFMSYPLALLRKHGIGGAALCISDSDLPYRQFVKSQKKLGSDVKCSREFKEMGTAGGLKNAEKYVKSSPFFVFNGDVLTDMNLTEMIKFHKRKKSLITVSLIQVSDPSACGLVLTEPSGRIKKFIEKPSKDILKSNGKPYWINAGIYLFEKDVLDMIPSGTNYSTEKELLPGCLKKKMPLYGFKIGPSTYWLDMGTPEKYLQANREAASQHLRRFFNLPESARLGKRLAIEKSAQIGRDVVIGDNSFIGAKCSVKNSVLLQGVRVESGTTLKDCVIGNRAVIGHDSVIEKTKIIENKSKIAPFSKL